MHPHEYDSYFLNMTWQPRLPRVCSFMSNSLPTPWTGARQTPLPVELSKQERWSGFPSPTPGHLPYPGIEPASAAPPALAGGPSTREAPSPPADLLCQSLWGMASRHQRFCFLFFIFFKLPRIENSCVEVTGLGIALTTLIKQNTIICTGCRRHNSSQRGRWTVNPQFHSQTW